MSNKRINQSVFILLLIPMISFALPDDSDQLIDITSVSFAIVDDADTGQTTITYTGSVMATQGSLKIEGDQATGIFENGELIHLTITGNPATYQQQPEADKETIHGRGKTIEYSQGINLLTIEDQAQFIMEKSTLSAFYIEYDIGLQQAAATALNNQSLINIEIINGEKIILGSAMKATHDNISGIVTLDDNVKFTQGQVTSILCHVEYNMQTQSVYGSGCNDEDRVYTEIQPENEE